MGVPPGTRQGPQLLHSGLAVSCCWPFQLCSLLTRSVVRYCRCLMIFALLITGQSSCRKVFGDDPDCNPDIGDFQLGKRLRKGHGANRAFFQLCGVSLAMRQGLGTTSKTARCTSQFSQFLFLIGLNATCRASGLFGFAYFLSNSHSFLDSAMCLCALLAIKLWHR